MDIISDWTGAYFGVFVTGDFEGAGVVG